jgi:thiamine-monophosphate kinase
MAALARRHGVVIAGGNLARANGGMVIDVTLIGEVPIGCQLTRAAARAGDDILVTGYPGDSAAGLDLILRPNAEALPADASAPLLLAHRRPEPRLAVGARLSHCAGVGAAIDISDGLAADLGHVLAASGVGATIDVERLPISAALATFAAVRQLDAAAMTLHGGEAYELLFTCRHDVRADVERELASSGVRVTAIGTIESEPGLRVRRADRSIVAESLRGHDHFVEDAPP